MKPASPFVLLVTRWGSRLRWPWLFVLTAALFLLDLVIPDFIPLADEILLGLLTLLFAAWRKRREPSAEEPPHEPKRVN